jgi:hypothetical protein
MADVDGAIGWPRSYTGRYLFSSFLKCGLCGSNIVLIAADGRGLEALRR